MAKGFGGSCTITAAKAQRDLGFKIIPLEVMVKDCYDWMVAEGRI
jgi:nucleoside-diphosphate-sugar epimerase